MGQGRRTTPAHLLRRESRVIKAILFDLDETLLDIDLASYIRMFALRRVRLISQIAQRPMVSLAISYGTATKEMLGERDDDLFNDTFLARAFYEQTEIPLNDPTIADCLDYYDREVFNPASERSVRHRPCPGALETLECCLSMGITVALATNPTFPACCTQQRMRWAGVDQIPFATVSYLENSKRTKPWADYYLDIARRCGCEPQECLMVGNDPRYDFPAQDCPIPTLYVGTKPDARAAWSGSMEDLPAALPRLVELLGASAE